MSKTASSRHLQNEIDRLKRVLAQKNLLIEDLRASTPEGIRDLFGTYRHLRPLLEILQHAAKLQDPIHSPAPNPGRSGGESKEEGLGTRRDRKRVRRWDEKIGFLVFDWRQEIGDVEPERGLRDIAPRCQKDDCDLKGRRQSLDAEVCRGCEEPLKTAS